MNKKGIYEVDFSDFKQVLYVEVSDILTEEMIEEGIEEADNMILTVGLTNHAYKRVYDTENRWVDVVDINKLIKDKGDVFFKVPMGEEFIIANEERTLAILGVLRRFKAEVVFEVITVIRKVFVDKYGIEREKKVFLPENLPNY